MQDNCARFAEENQFQTIAFSAIGAGSGGYDTQESIEIMINELEMIQPTIQVTLVKYHKKNKSGE